MSVFKSGAFLQQCFSVHPLSLDLKLATPEIVGVICTNCRMRHRMTIHTGIAPPKKTERGSQELLHLQHCFHGHAEDVRISLVNVQSQVVEFRCRTCRRTYVLDVALYETHQS